MYLDVILFHQVVQGHLTSMQDTIHPPLQLIELISLLGAGNPVLNQLYLNLVNKTVTKCYETQLKLDECRHLIYLIFRHPAFTAAERATLLHWVDIFDRLFPTQEAESGYSSGGSDRSSSCSPSPTQDKMFMYNAHIVLPFANTASAPPLPPPTSMFPSPHCRRNNGLVFKRSHSDPAPGSSSFYGSRCKMPHNRERAIDITPHMTALMSWLKSLRLHKYYPKLSVMSYDEMLELNEEKLKDITEGARRKILLNIQKLSSRSQSLTDTINDLSKPGRFNSCITELHNMLMKTPFRLPPSSPLAPNPDTEYDAPETELIVLYTKVLEKAGNIILANNIDEDCQKLFFKLLEDAGQHAAFPGKQRRIVCDIFHQCIDNYNYRNGGILPNARLDPSTVKIRYPIKPTNGANHHNTGYNNSYNKYNNNTSNLNNRPKPSWNNQFTRSISAHVNGLNQPHTPPGAIALPPSQPLPTSLARSLANCPPAPAAPGPSFNPFPTSIWSNSGSTASFGAMPMISQVESHQKSEPMDYGGLESLCSQIAECALAEK